MALSRGSIPKATDPESIGKLVSKGMVILSGDGKVYVPVHPRLAIANGYRTWREDLVRKINSRRMKVDKLILQLIPLYETAMEKRHLEAGR